MLNTTGWSFLQFILILPLQDFKCCKPYLRSMESRSKLQQIPFVLIYNYTDFYLRVPKKFCEKYY